MDNLISSLVGDIASNAGNASGGLVDYQGKSYDPQTILSLAKQVTASIDPNAVKGGVFSTKGESVGFNYDEATKLLGHPPSAAEQVALDMARHLSNEGVTDINNVDATTTNRRFGSTYTGGGGTIYEIKKDADGKPIISTWSKDTSNKKEILGGLALAALAFGIPGISEGLLSSASTGSTIGTVGASTVTGLTGAELAAAEMALGAGSYAGGSTLGTLGALGTEAAVAGMGTGTGLTAAGAGGLGGASGAAGLGGSLGSGLTAAGAGGLGGLSGAAGLGGSLGSGLTAGAGGLALGNSLLGGSTLGSTLGSLATGVGAGALGSTLGGLSTGVGSALGAGAGSAAGSAVGSGAGSALGTGAGSALGTSLATGLGISALGNVLGSAANQSGISDARNLINQYGTQAQGNLAKAYADAQALNVANRGDLASNYGKTQGNLYDIYNQQVGIQQPYQNVGQAGSQGLIGNQDYFNRQFTNADLNANLAPNYAFQLQQGQMANQRAANMGGGSMGGNALQGLQRYTQDYAGNAYQNAFTNFQNQRQNIYNTLSGMANIGTTSGGQLASLGNTLGGNLGSLSSNYGGNLTTSAGQGINAANAYGLNTANLATGIGSALAGNAVAGGANTANALNTLGNTALLGSMIKAT
jgi:hypothetical protein